MCRRQVWWSNKGREKTANGFTLIELIIVIIVLGILSVTAAPRIFTGTDTQERAAERDIYSLLRLTQQRAMQDTRENCYGVEITSSAVTPVTCGGSPFTADIPIPDTQTISLTNVTTSTTETLPAVIYFNALGCPVLNSNGICGGSRYQITLTGTTGRSLCLNSQGYLEEGAC